MSDDPFDGLPLISKEDGLKMRTGAPMPIDPDVIEARAVLADIERTGTVSLDQFKDMLGINGAKIAHLRSEAIHLEYEALCKNREADELEKKLKPTNDA